MKKKPGFGVLLGMPMLIRNRQLNTEQPYVLYDIKKSSSSPQSNQSLIGSIIAWIGTRRCDIVTEHCSHTDTQIGDIIDDVIS